MEKILAFLIETKIVYEKFYIFECEITVIFFYDFGVKKLYVQKVLFSFNYKIETKTAFKISLLFFNLIFLYLLKINDE